MVKKFAFLRPNKLKIADITAPSSWKSLHLFNIYRLTLAIACFFIPYYYTEVVGFLGHYYNDLFKWTNIFYLCFGIICFFTIYYRVLSFKLQVLIQISVDIIVITLIMHSSGGFNEGLGVFLIIAVIGGGGLTEIHLDSEGRVVFFFAAIASLALLLHVFFAKMHINYYPMEGNSYSQASIFGIAFFATALLTYILAKKSKLHAQLAEQRRITLYHLAKLDKEITPGILIINMTAHIYFVNEAACFLLGWKADKIRRAQKQNSLLVLLAPELSAHFDKWQLQGKINKSILSFYPQANLEVLATFTKLEHVGTSIVLEGAAQIAQRTQEVKLVALGRLTAAIAHEVRNPLSAISQAGQLLEEDTGLSEKNISFIKIILRNCGRINNTIEGVLQLGRTQLHESIEKIDLIVWIRNFTEEFIQNKQLKQQHIKIDILQPTALIQFNLDQLHRVVYNLCENGLRSALRENPEDSILLKLTIGSETHSNRIYLNVCDQGAGIRETAIQYIFEPFFTTENGKTVEKNVGKGTGLGLYIAKESCDANGATLRLLTNDRHNCCFQILFAKTD